MIKKSTMTSTRMKRKRLISLCKRNFQQVFRRLSQLLELVKVNEKIKKTMNLMENILFLDFYPKNTSFYQSQTQTSNLKNLSFVSNDSNTSSLLNLNQNENNQQYFMDSRRNTNESLYTQDYSSFFNDWRNVRCFKGQMQQQTKERSFIDKKNCYDNKSFEIDINIVFFYIFL